MITGQRVNENRNPEERKDEFWKFCGMMRIVHEKELPGQSRGAPVSEKERETNFKGSLGN